MGDFLKRLQRFLGEDIWRMRVSNLPRAKSWAIQMLRVLLLTFREFDKDKCQLRASAMTFYSLLVIVPVVALIFGIAKGFGYDQQLQGEFRTRFRVALQLKDGAAPALAKQLAPPVDPLPKHLYEHKFSAEAKDLLGEYHAGQASPLALKEALEAELNRLLDDPALDPPGGIALDALSDELKVLQERRRELEGEELIRYNSLLLDAAFPDTVKPLSVMDQGRNQVVEKTIEFSNNLLKSSHGGLIAGAGILILLWTVIRMLQTIEHSLNEIWGIRRRRTFRRMLSNYLSLMFVFPLLLVLFPALAQYVQARVDNFAGDPRLFDQLVRLTPFLLLWLLLSFAYILTPNTKVNLLSGILAGLVAALIFVAVQKLIIALQIGVSKYSPVYGSFLAFPLLLIWLHASWMIMLFGAEFSFAHQNVGTYEFEQDCAGISHAYKTLLALRISHLSVKRFHQGEPPLTAQEAAQLLHLPIRLVRDILFELCEAGVLTEFRRDERKDLAYQPARDPATLSVKSVKEALDQRGSANIPVIESKELRRLAECLAEFDKALESSSANVLLRDV